MKILLRAYPNQKWNEEKFKETPKKSSQWRLCKIIKEILPPNVYIFEEYAHPFLRFATGGAIVFDIYISSLNLVLEYQGIQHYYDHFMFGEATALRQKDDERLQACKLAGITLIRVPYWWQRDKESIVAILNQHRPDVAPCELGSEVTPFLYGPKTSQAQLIVHKYQP